MPRKNAVAKLIFFLMPFIPWMSADEDAQAHFQSTIEALRKKDHGATYQILQFEEQRIFPFKKKPTVLNGTIRIWKNKASSIAYPDKGIVIVSRNNGSIYRKLSPNGKKVDRSIPASRSGFNLLLSSLFTLDFGPIETSSYFEYSQTAEACRLTLRPKPGFQMNLDSLHIEIDKESIREIRIDFGKGKSIRILPLSKTILETEFSALEIETYF